MKDKSNRRMAELYTQVEGERLRLELEALEQNGTTSITPRMDARVRARIAAKRKRFTAVAGLLAACLVLLLALPFVLQSKQANPDPVGYTPFNDPSYAILPLNAVLPTTYEIAAVEQDIEKTVYYLESDTREPVVVTLEQTEDIAPYQALASGSLNGHSVYGEANDDYCLLAFEKSNVLYVLTCADDMNALLDIGKSILV